MPTFIKIDGTIINIEQIFFIKKDLRRGVNITSASGSLINIDCTPDEILHIIKQAFKLEADNFEQSITSTSKKMIDGLTENVSASEISWTPPKPDEIIVTMYADVENLQLIVKNVDKDEQFFDCIVIENAGDLKAGHKVLIPFNTEYKYV